LSWKRRWIVGWRYWMSKWIEPVTGLVSRESATRMRSNDDVIVYAYGHNLALLVRYYFHRRHQRGFPAGLLYRGDNSSLLTSSGRVGLMSAYHAPSAETNPPELVDSRCKGASMCDVAQSFQQRICRAIVAGNPNKSEKCAAGRIHHHWRPGEPRRGPRRTYHTPRKNQYFPDVKGGLVRYLWWDLQTAILESEICDGSLNSK